MPLPSLSSILTPHLHLLRDSPASSSRHHHPATMPKYIPPPRGGHSATGPSPDSTIPIQVAFRTLTQEVTLPRPSAKANDLHELSLWFGVSLEKGLDATAVSRRLAKVGPNVLSPPRTDWFRKTMGYLFGGFAAIMWIAAIVTFIAWQPLGGDNPAPANLALAVSILLVIFLQASFTAYQDFTSSRIMSSINSMLPQSTTVTRANGAQSTVPSSGLVPGDLVHLTYGSKVPADLRIISHTGLKVDNSILTGESLPIHCTVEATDDNVLESHNMVFMGTFVTEGQGIGVVIATGDRTVMGQVASLASRTRVTQTTLQREIIRFSIVIGSLAISTALACFAWYMLALRNWYPTFLDLSTFLSTDMGVLVAFTPEGLPIAVTVVLTIVARRMFQQRVLVKNLSVVETLGCCSVLCSDKTGTLTTNQMVVSSAVVGLTTPLAIGGSLRSTTRNTPHPRFDQADMHLPIHARRVQGDATDVAMLRFAHAHVDAGAQAAATAKVMHVPFNSKTKRMVTVLASVAGQVPPEFLKRLAGKQDLAGDEQVLLVKGAPDLLSVHVTRYMDEHGEDVLLDEVAQAKLRKLQEDLSSQGQRVLLIARRVLAGQDKVIGDIADNELMVDNLIAAGDLSLVGLLGIVDPPRPETKDVVNTLRGAGVRVMMVTGDFQLTATAIARECGIVTKQQVHTFEHLDDAVKKECRPLADDELMGRVPIPKLPGSASNAMIRERLRTKAALVLTGANMSDMTDAHWSIACDYEEVVFARTTPEHKLQIVHAFQERGEIVAVTGDGVNDAPALKNAHLGVAMGGGSDVAMAAGDMVLLDSNLASVVVALREGRVVFENLKKVCLYLLPAGSFSELTPVLVNLFLGVPLPLSGFLMIVICVLTDLFVSLALMYEEAESDLLLRPPRRPNRDRMVNAKLLAQAYLFVGMIESILAHMMFFVYMYREWGLSPSHLLFAFDQYTEAALGIPQADLITANNGGQCVYFATLVILQFGNALAARTRYMSMVNQSPLKNPMLFVAMVASLLVAIVFVYLPQFNDIIGTHGIPFVYWLFPIPLAVVERPESVVAKLAW
ncbi:hypothetical protein BCR44DRAFT_1423068 [Catenaria anguillulae PL171]|uniref:Cation-transporting P-type ATPase N-terminal domain-containing protein n=1 Tax=Catenaria anguillulae PL171 TaxID=765915 RepID=A0A1Y2I5H3_9FUNG|nr:hypothetical protein BCR44DRAFT_1423068 [Catenaria anguillulae PL171]